MHLARAVDWTRIVVVVAVAGLTSIKVNITLLLFHLGKEQIIIIFVFYRNLLNIIICYFSTLVAKKPRVFYTYIFLFIFHTSFNLTQ